MIVGTSNNIIYTRMRKLASLFSPILILDVT